MSLDPHFFSIAFTLFLLMDALGNIPLFISILKNFPPKKQRKIILRELIIALFVIVSFYFIGDILLNLLNIKQHTILISGGIILFIIAIHMILPDAFYSKPKRASSPSAEPLIVPLAVPLIAGPAVLASIILYSNNNESPFTVLSAIFAAWIASSIILLSASSLQKILGDRGLTACERLMGLLLTLISVQMFLQGISLYTCTVNQTPH